MTEFGPVETVTVSELKEGDFVVEVPSQRGARGYRVNSGVRDLRDDFGTWRVGPPRRKMPVKSRIVMFLDTKLSSLNVPDDFVVSVRRQVVETGGSQ